MKIRSKFEVIASQYGEQAAALAQQALARSADLVGAVPSAARGAVQGAGAFAARVEPLVEVQLDTLEAVAAQGAKRLKAASEAASLDALLKGQAALLPESKAIALERTRVYLELYFSAKEKLDGAVKAKVMSWVATKPAKARKAPVAAAEAA